MIARWKAKLAIRRRLLRLAQRRHAYWRNKQAKAKPNSSAWKHARFRADQRGRDVLKRQRQVEAAQRVIARHSTPTGISKAGVDFIKEFEGFYGKQYNDGVGVMTIGYGTTAADISPLPKTMTEARASELLQQKLNSKYVPPVLKALAKVHPTQNMVDACASFSYNLGEGAFRGAPGFETLTRALRKGDVQGIADAILLYDNPNDPAVHAGLKRRRKAERAMFLS